MKPKIFISSTIYDFRDIRSALKYFLEQYDYSVQLSEYNDFNKEFDLNSYEACLESINDANYFILFIGSRTGGYFDKTNNISITQKEYQTAYELAKLDKLKLLIFVRDEIWNIKEDRKSLQKFLENDLVLSKELSDEDIETISNHKSLLVNNAKSIFNFLDEVSRKEEMLSAINGTSEFPKNNWVHPFKTFRDVIDVVKTALKLNSSLQELSLRHNLVNELTTNIQSLLNKNKDEILESREWAKFGRNQISSSLDKPSEMPFKYFKWLSIYALTSSGKRHYISNYFIEKAISSGFYLEYNSKKNLYEESIISKNLVILNKRTTDFYRFGKLASENIVKFISKYEHLKHTPDDEVVVIENLDIITYLVLHDCEKDIMNLSIALYKGLQGNLSLLENISLSPVTPFKDEAEKMTKESPSFNETINWLSKK